METSFLKIKCNKETYYEYEKEIIKSGICGSLLSGNFIKISDEAYMIFNTENHILLSEYISDKRKDIGIFGSDIENKVFYKLMREMLYSFEDIFFHLLNPDDMNLSSDYIFINPKNQKIKIAYLPKRKDGEIINKFIACLYSLCDIACEANWKFIVENFYNYILKNHPSIKNMIYYLNEKIIE